MASPAKSAPVAKIAPSERIAEPRELALPEKRRRKRPSRALLRGVLLGLGPLVFLAGALYVYLAGGRYATTDDAYVKVDKIQVSADVAGRVSAVPVNENQHVKAGEVLFRIDDEPFRLAVDSARARLEGARNDIEALKADWRAKLAELKKAQDTVAYYQREVDRNRGLTSKGFVSAQHLDDAEHNLQVAQATVATDRQAIAHDVAALGGNPDLPVEQQALYLQAKSALDQAQLDLRRTVVRAPVEGIVTNVALRAGDYVKTGDGTFALVPSDRIWVEGNFKETDLTHVAPGQPAAFTVDTYPGRRFAARVESIAPASGSEFALLPPQNASGNWVKVVQRIPVRLALEHYDGNPPLRAGMSVSAEIDTGHRRSLGELWATLRSWVGWGG
jgi:membrane fusion protein (multidrug efflux system)